MPKTAFILSYERPMYLWATLDALVRATQSDVHYTLVDQGSRDPLVHEVIRGFVTRGLISEVVHMQGNDPANILSMFVEHYDSIGEIFFYIENDVVVEPGDVCWTDRMQSLMEANDRLAMLGSVIDGSDFISRERLERLLGREASRKELDAIKWFSPERNMPQIASGEVVRPFNPPGRLLALRKSAIAGFRNMRDSWLDEHLRGQGWETGITGAVRHRHLSLLNFFDFPNYNMAERDRFMDGLRLQDQVPPV